MLFRRRPDDRVPELLDAALHVFAERGYRRTRLDDVAARAGVTKGTIYHYFETKEALLVAVIEHYQALAFGRIEDALRDSPPEAPERLRQVVRRTFLESTAPRQPLLTLLIRGAATELPRVHARWMREGPVRLWKLMARIIASGQRRGEFSRRVDAEAAARGFVTGLLLQLLWRQHRRGVPELAIDEEDLVEQNLELLLTSLRR